MLTEEELLRYASSSYSRHKIIALANEGVTSNVVKKVIKALMNCKILNEELFDLLFEKIKSINNYRLFLEVMDSPFFTQEMADYLSDKANYSILIKLIGSQFATEEMYLKILNSLFNGPYHLSMSDTSRIAMEMLKGKALTSKVLEMIVDHGPNDADLNEVLKSSFVDYEVYKKAVMKCFKMPDDYPLSIDTIFDSPLMNKKVLGYIIKRSKDGVYDFYKKILASDYCDADILCNIPIYSNDVLFFFAMLH